MANILVSNGRQSQAIPLWIRIIEIEQKALGDDHPDVFAVKDLLREELENPDTTDDAVSAYTERLFVHDKPRRDAPNVIAPHAANNASGDAVHITAPQSANNGTLASLGTGAVEMAAAVGSATVSGAVRLGFSAASSTSSLVMGATGRVASFAARRSLGEGAADAAEVVGSAAMAATKSMAGGTFEATQQATANLSASAATSAISLAGHSVLTGTAWAAGGAQTLLRRFSSPDVSVPVSSVQEVDHDVPIIQKALSCPDR
jgi:hypothetical protein